MKILFLYLNPFDWASIAAPPYGLEIISNYLKRHIDGIEIEIKNPYIEDVITLENMVSSYSPKLIGISMRNLDNMANIWSEYAESNNGIKTGSFIDQICNIIERIKKVTEADIFIGGAGFSIAPEKILKKVGLDIGISGPGEKTVLKLVQAVMAGRDLRQFIIEEHDDLKGIVHIYNKKVIMEQQEHCMGENEIKKFERAVQYDSKWVGSVPVRVSSGCNGKCSYCVEGQTFCTAMWRSIPEIVQEIKLIDGSETPVWLVCSELNFPYEEKVMDLCNAIGKAKINRKFSSYFLPKPFSIDMYEALKKINFTDHSICFGITHVSDMILEKNGISFRRKDIDNIINIFKKVGAKGITVGCILGLPGENEETLNEIISWFKEVDEIFGEGFHCFYNCGVRVYPNTPLADIIQNRTYDKDLYGWKDKDLLKPVVLSMPYEPEKINQIVKENTKECQAIISSYNMGNNMMNDQCEVVINWQIAQYLQNEGNIKDALKRMIIAYNASKIKTVKEHLIVEIVQILVKMKKNSRYNEEDILDVIRNTIFEKMIMK